MKTYMVHTADGRDHTILADYVFNNDGSLLFRRYKEDESGKTYIVGEFADGWWRTVKEIQPSEDNNG
jgi:hypothetical protein